jgi:cell division protein ZapA
MADVNITINGRTYEISCDSGQEGRIVDLAAYIDQRLQEISRSGAAYNDAHLMVLTALVLTDELFETRELASSAAGASRGQKAAPGAAAPSKEDELALARVLETLAKRIDGIAQRVQAA